MTKRLDVGRSDDEAAERTLPKTPRKQTTKRARVSADRINTGRRKLESRQPAPDAAIRKPPLFSPSDSDSSEAGRPSVALGTSAMTISRALANVRAAAIMAAKVIPTQKAEEANPTPPP